jgi:hypothetical protein
MFATIQSEIFFQFRLLFENLKTKNIRNEPAICVYVFLYMVVQLLSHT